MTVLSHKLNNGQERPIAYASRTLSTIEQRYPQIDKEAMAIVWAVQKFFYYLYAYQFTIITDHKPLTQILIQRNHCRHFASIAWQIMPTIYRILISMSYLSQPKKTPTQIIALRLMPLTTSSLTTHQITQKEREEIEIEYDGFDQFVLHQIKQLPINAESIACKTKKDPLLGKITQLLEAGQDLARSGYKAPEANYRLGSNCLVFKHRTFISPVFRETILKELHTAHLGII